MENVHKQEVHITNEEARTKSLEDAHTIRCLTLERDRLREELKIYKNLEKENTDMRETILNLQSQIEKLQKIAQKEAQRARAEITEYRKVIEEEFRKKMKEVEQEAKDIAFRELSQEAKKAMDGNAKLQDILSNQNQSLEEVLGKLKSAEVEQKKMKLERDLEEEASQLNKQELRKLRKQLDNAQSKFLDLNNEVRSKKVEREALELIYDELEKSKNEQERYRQKYKTAKKEIHKWKSRALVLKDINSNSLSPSQVQVKDSIKKSARERKQQQAQMLNEKRRLNTSSGVGGIIHPEARKILESKNARELFANGETEGYFEEEELGFNNNNNNNHSDDSFKFKKTDTMAKLMSVWSSNFVRPSSISPNTSKPSSRQSNAEETAENDDNEDDGEEEENEDDDEEEEEAEEYDEEEEEAEESSHDRKKLKNEKKSNQHRHHHHRQNSKSSSQEQRQHHHHHHHGKHSHHRQHSSSQPASLGYSVKILSSDDEAENTSSASPSPPLKVATSSSSIPPIHSSDGRAWERSREENDKKTFCSFKVERSKKEDFTFRIASAAELDTGELFWCCINLWRQ